MKRFLQHYKIISVGGSNKLPSSKHLDHVAFLNNFTYLIRDSYFWILLQDVTQTHHQASSKT